MEKSPVTKDRWWFPREVTADGTRIIIPGAVDFYGWFMAEFGGN